MAWLRLDDNLDSDPVILNVCQTQSEVTRVVGMVTRLMLYCARQLTDGYMPEVMYRDLIRSRVWRERLTAPPNGGVALVHRRGDTCSCLKGREWPDTAADYYVHHYLSSNPSRDEYDVQRAKQAELRDTELRATVKRRDRSRCRYCGVVVAWADRRSSVGGVFDHVDPRLAAGAANLVVACRGCNSRKGNRTPAAAGMTLLPVPSGRDLRQNGGSDLDPTNGSGVDTTTHARVRDGTGKPVHDTGPPAIGPPTTVRTSGDPNPYHRSAVTGLDPDDHAGLPGPIDIEFADAFGEELEEDIE